MTRASQVLILVLVASSALGCRYEGSRRAAAKRSPRAAAAKPDAGRPDRETARVKQAFARAVAVPLARVKQVRRYELERSRHITGILTGLYAHEELGSVAGIVFTYRCGKPEPCVKRDHLGAADRVELLRVVDILAPRTVFVPNRPVGPSQRVREPASARWPALLVRIRTRSKWDERHTVIGFSVRRAQRPRRLLWVQTLRDATKVAAPVRKDAGKGGLGSVGIGGGGLRCGQYGIHRVEAMTFLGSTKPPEFVVRQRRVETEPSRCSPREKTVRDVRYRMKRFGFRQDPGTSTW